MTQDEEDKLFAGLATLTDMLKQVQITVLANQAVLLAHLAMEKAEQEGREDGLDWFESLKASTSVTLADVILDYGPLASVVAERTAAILKSIEAAKIADPKDEN